jgi:hypothetical protein
MRLLAGSLVCVLLLGGATASGAQEPTVSGAQEAASCEWVTDPATVQDAALHAVTADKPKRVLAVGYRVNAKGRTRTLVRHWDGSSWETQPSPNVDGRDHELNDVAVVPKGRAWAVGTRKVSAEGEKLKTKTMVQKYDGTSWKMRSSLNPSTEGNMFVAVDVAPSGDVYAAGARLNAKRKFRTMIHRGDGSAWKVFGSDYPGLLWDIDVIANNDVWAVGEKGVGVQARAFVLHFDGTRWTQATTPSPGEGFSTLFSVSAAAPDDVWAVGEWWGGDNGHALPWIVHFDGTSWSAPKIPDLTTGTTGVGLFGVSALDADTAVAVGVDYSYPVEDSRVLIEWDGTSWTRGEQEGDSHSGWLLDVDLAPDGGGWTVGHNQMESPSTGFVSTDYMQRRTCG